MGLSDATAMDGHMGNAVAKIAEGMVKPTALVSKVEVVRSKCAVAGVSTAKFVSKGAVKSSSGDVHGGVVSSGSKVFASAGYGVMNFEVTTNGISVVVCRACEDSRGKSV